MYPTGILKWKVPSSPATISCGSSRTTIFTGRLPVSVLGVQLWAPPSAIPAIVNANALLIMLLITEKFKSESQSY